MTKHDHLQPRMLKEREAAELLAMEVTTLRRWRWAGKGPRFLKIGGAVRYDPADLEAFIGEARQTSTSDNGANAQAGEVSHG